MGIDKDKPKEAVTVAVKMLKGEWGGGGARGVLSRMPLLWHVNSVMPGVREHIADLEVEEFSG